jgi:hypothetical protein
MDESPFCVGEVYGLMLLRRGAHKYPTEGSSSLYSSGGIARKKKPQGGCPTYSSTHGLPVSGRAQSETYRTTNSLFQPTRKQFQVFRHVAPGFLASNKSHSSDKEKSR